MPRRVLSPAQAVLLVALAGLAALWLLSDRGTEGNGGRLVASVAFPPEEVHEIVFEKPGGEARALRTEDGFWLTDPYPDRADDELIAQSCRAAATLESIRELPDTAGAEFGLASPSAVWRCRWPGGEYVVELGDTLPAGAGRYARLGSRREIVIVDPFIARRFLSPPFKDLHDPSPSRIRIGPIDSLAIATRDEEMRIVRRAAQRWEIVHPLQAEGSAPDLARAVHALSSDCITDFLGPIGGQDLRALGLDPPRARWTLIQGAQRETVRIGNPTKDQRSVHIIPAGRKVVALVGSENFRAWVDGLQRLRETRLFDSVADSVIAVSIAGGSQTRRFVRPGEGLWREIAGGDTLAIRSDAMAAAVSNLCALRAVEFLPNPPPQAERNRLTVRLEYALGSVDRFEIVGSVGERVAATGPRQPGWCAVPISVRTTWDLWLHRPLRPARASSG